MKEFQDIPKSVCNKNQPQQDLQRHPILFSAKEAMAILWDILLVDLIRSYKIRREGHDEPLILKYLTMIYPKTMRFKILQYNNKMSVTTAKIV